MALEQKLRLKLAQRLVMTPSLQQAIKLLQLSRLELEEALSQEILENPVLDVEEQPEETAAAEEVSPETPERLPAEDAKEEPPISTTPDDDSLPSAEETYNDIDVEAFFADYLADSRSEGPSMTTYNRENQVPLENMVSVSPGLNDHLIWQLRMADCPQQLTIVCEFIIGNLDEDGMLQASDMEIQAATGAGLEDIQSALSLVRTLDPPGVASRSLQECLIAQLDLLLVDPPDGLDLGLLERVRLIVAEHWDALLHQRWEKLAAAIGCKVGELKEVIEVIHRLEPKPGRAFAVDRNQYIEPDVYVKKVDGEYSITLNDDGLPRLRINSKYARMLEGGVVDPQVGTYLKEKMRNAVWLMKSIDQRQRTIYKVANSIVEFQREFLDQGIEHLRPMVLRQVAEDIGMHESTISRVVSNKYMYTLAACFQ